MKFTDAYWKIGKEIITVDDISNIYENEINAFHAQYEEHLFCPECRQAQLVYVNGLISYLRSFPNSEHLPDCSLRQAILPVRQAEKLLTSTGVEDQEYVQRQMQSVLSRISRDSMMITKPIANSPVSKTPHVVTSGSPVITTARSKRLMQKNLYSRLDEDEYGVPMISYGTVRVNWERHYDENKKRYQYCLLLWRTKKTKSANSNLICKVTVSQSVYAHIPEEYKLLKNSECHVTLFTTFKNYGKSYKVTYLRYAAYLKMLVKTTVV